MKQKIKLSKLFQFVGALSLLFVGLAQFHGNLSIFDLVAQGRQKDFSIMVQNLAEQIDGELKKIERSTVVLGLKFVDKWQTRPAIPPSELPAFIDSFTAAEKTMMWVNGEPNPKISEHRAPTTAMFATKGKISQEQAWKMFTLVEMSDAFTTIGRMYESPWVYASLTENVLFSYPAPSFKYANNTAYPTQQHYYKAADFANRAPAWEDPYNDIGGEGIMVTVSNPVYDQDKLLAVFSHDILIEKLITPFLNQPNVTEETQTIVITKTGKAIIVSDDKNMHEIISADKKRYHGTLYYRQSDFVKSLQKNAMLSSNKLLNAIGEAVVQIVDQDLKKLKSSYTFEKTFEDQSYLINATQVGTTGWVVVSFVPRSTLNFTITQSANRTLMLVISILAIIMLIAFYVIYCSVIKPVLNLTKVSIDFGKGDFSTRTTVFSPVFELASMEGRFNQMAEQVDQSHRAEKENEHRLEQEVADRTKELRQLAMTDQLTGLINRRQFSIQMSANLKLSKREKKILSLLMIDLDKFKQVNDNYGHPIGDAVLQAVAAILIENSRESDMIARVGGDEFAVLVIHPSQKADATLCAQRIIDKISKPIFIKNNEIQIGASIGIAHYPIDASNEEELIAKADLALYESKKDGRGKFALYHSRMEP